MEKFKIGVLRAIFVPYSVVSIHRDQKCINRVEFRVLDFLKNFKLFSTGQDWVLKTKELGTVTLKRRSSSFNTQLSWGMPLVGGYTFSLKKARGLEVEMK